MKGWLLVDPDGQSPRRPRPKRDLEQHTVQELREQARQAGVKGRSSMTKDQLIRALRERS